MKTLKERLYIVIFEADTRAGKLFDVALLFLILVSVVVVMLESVPALAPKYGQIFKNVEWVLTFFFLIEYILRLWVVHRPWKYAVSFFGFVDLLAIIPTFVVYFFAGAQSLMIVRAVRLLRLFRIFKLGHFLNEGNIIMSALIASRTKIFVFLYFVLILVTVFGAIMYLVEGAVNPGFSSIPNSIYWAIVTLTTVGYGDISPQTDIGKFLSVLVMLVGYAVIAVPTGIVTGEFVKKVRASTTSTQVCRSCLKEGHDADATFCKYCGESLH